MQEERETQGSETRSAHVRYSPSGITSACGAVLAPLGPLAVSDGSLRLLIRGRAGARGHLI